ncbi:sugar phosphate isomerase/epimerase family protein [Paenibacillus gallinarum]|uniref:Sugar phosphate isomerase/epimerase n=1 Tax=Paenibacillus gallinarum TaxID=2762232 RepID=A0ABR8SV27_9BACL|nr:sugar phosphate isomerase/epimerase [Paenibacillus gallinarum]MBD7967353.1 sugar phosphate isomerase/epimerase [Paenibacillus gallinarum]
MKLSVFTVATPDMTPKELVKAASVAGIEGIEWRYKGIPDEARAETPSFWGRNLASIDPAGTNDNILDIRNLTAQAGLTSIALVPYLSVTDLASTEQAFEAARVLGASMMRVGVPSYNRTENYHELYKRADAYLSEVQEMSRTYGVKALVETHHGTIAPSASLAYRLVSRFDPDHVGVLYDPGNMVHEGFENYRMGLEMLGPYLAHVHVKNAVWKKKEGISGTTDSVELEYECNWSPLLGGIVPWSQVLRDLVSVDYKGYLGIEDFSQSLSSEEMLKNFSHHMKALLGEIRAEV